MSAPTPQPPPDDQPHGPALPGGPLPPAAAPPDGGAGWTEWRAGLVTLVGSALLGVAGAGVWVWLAPRVPLILTGHQVYMQDSEGEQTIGQDGTFTLIAAAAGLLCGAAVFLWRRRGGVAVVLGTALGGLAAAAVMWRLGIVLGPETDLAAAARAAGQGKPFDGPFQLQAKAALLVWPLAAVVMHLVLTAGFGPREPYPHPWTPPAAPAEPGA